MPQFAIVHNLSKPNFPAVKTIYASTFLEKLRGLMFRKILLENEGLLLADASESRINTAIHMFFMNFDIGVVWLDSTSTVVDKTTAKRWRPFYAPKHPAQFTLELHPTKLDVFSVGDQIAISFEK